MKRSRLPRNPLKVFVADASSMGCQLMVRALQESRQPIKVVGSATESVEILKGLDANPSDVAIISADLREGPITGFRVVREARAAYPQTRIIVLVDTPERALVVEGFRAGADGVFSRSEPFEMLCKCIIAVCGGQIWARSEQLRFVTEALAKGHAQPIKSANGTHLLTKREEELVHLVAEGLTNRDISRQLGLTEHTVRNYLFRIFNKLGTSNRLELALYVIKQRGVQGADFGNGCLPEPALALRAGRPLREIGPPSLSSED
jgi:two-component system, NarL family, nitrate/nitrite response regulator NarL